MLSILISSGCGVQKNYNITRYNRTKIIDGRLNRDQLNKEIKDNWLTNNYNSYQLNSLELQKLVQTNFDSISFLIFAGSWCSDTKLQLPRFLRVLDTLNASKNPMEFYFLDLNKKSKFISPAVFKINLVPTFVILRDGKEIGRIEETPKESIEKDLLNILRSNY